MFACWTNAQPRQANWFKLPVATALAAIIMAGSGFRLGVASKDVQRGVHGKAARALVLRMALKEASPRAVAAWPVLFPQGTRTGL